MKVLHISFHRGCQNDIEYIAKQLNFELTYMVYHCDLSAGNDKYNITHEKAEYQWAKHKDYYNSFDVIITSDTTPISRIFLQNPFEKKLIIWICNRFDYADGAPSPRFPDQEYYDLINGAKHRPNVHLIGYTAFENYYANHVKHLSIGNRIIKPIGKIGTLYENYTPTIVEKKSQTYIIGPYHNDNIMMNLRETAESLGIRVYNGRYNGPKDLAEFAGMIHIPYAWSNLALFETIQMEVPYFIPSLAFIKEMQRDRQLGQKFFWSPPLLIDMFHLSEWYCDELKDVFIYFDSWNDLQQKIASFDRDAHKKKLREFGDKHEANMLQLWREIL
jgi:hypothetical protein